MVGKRNEGGFKQVEDISNLRGLLKRNQKLSAFYAVQSSAGQGSSLFHYVQMPSCFLFFPIEFVSLGTSGCRW